MTKTTPAAQGEQRPAAPATRKVRWTKNGEISGAYSEHGQHKAGDEIDTMHAEHLIRQTWAEPIFTDGDGK